MQKTILILFGLSVIGACAHQASTTMGQSVFNSYFDTCVRNRGVIEKFGSFDELADYCGCRARYIAENTTFEEHRDMVAAKFETGLTKISARVLNDAENHCNRK